MFKSTSLANRYLQQRHELITPTHPKRNQPEWIIARSLCHYRLFKLTDIPLNRRDSVLKLQIQQWSPFANPGSYQVWQGTQVQVWIWDQDQQFNLQKELVLKKVKVLPETILRPPSSRDNLCLVSCLEGIEGQIWKDGQLIGSRWWLQLPSQTEWDRFQRAHGLAAQIERPEPLEIPLSKRPWGRHKTSQAHLALGLRLAVLGISIAMTVSLTWYTVRIWQWQTAISQVEQQIEQLGEKVAPLLASRNQALLEQQHIQEISQFDTYPSQLELLSYVLQHLPSGALMVHWLYRAGRLSFTIEMEQPDPIFFVKTYEESPLFEDVKTEVGTGQYAKNLIISLRVLPKPISSLKEGK